MQLRKWCVSMTFEPMRFFWTQRAADRFFWQRRGTGTGYHSQELDKLMGLYRWDGARWRKQVYMIDGTNGGMTKSWFDDPESAKAS